MQWTSENRRSPKSGGRTAADEASPLGVESNRPSADPVDFAAPCVSSSRSELPQIRVLPATV